MWYCCSVPHDGAKPNCSHYSPGILFPNHNHIPLSPSGNYRHPLFFFLCLLLFAKTLPSFTSRSNACHFYEGRQWSQISALYPCLRAIRSWFSYRLNPAYKCLLRFFLFRRVFFCLSSFCLYSFPHRHHRYSPLLEHP